MLDIHSHILPGVDDGAKDWDTALEMCRLAQRDGITHVVATPHANEQYSFDRAKHQAVLDELQARCTDLRFSLGCEFHLSFENVEAALEDPRPYAIGNSRFLLTELSDYGTPAQFKALIFRLHCRGFVTVIAHPERNPILAQYSELAAELVAMGCLLQITGDSLYGVWGRSAQKRSESFLKAGLVSVISSDAHDRRRRPPNLSKARKAAAKIIGNAGATRLVEEIPAFLANQNYAFHVPELDVNKPQPPVVEASEPMGAYKLNHALRRRDPQVIESETVVRS